MNSPRILKLREPCVLPMLLLTCCSAAAPVFAQSQEPIPVVTSASVPSYPRDAQNAYISGTVKLQISTDGTHATSTVVKSGPPLLTRYAEENVKTWEFERHSPTSFEVRFVFILQPADNDPKSLCGDVRHSTVILKLPTHIEVTAKAPTTCDPTEKIVH